MSARQEGDRWDSEATLYFRYLSTYYYFVLPDPEVHSHCSDPRDKAVGYYPAVAKPLFPSRLRITKRMTVESNYAHSCTLLNRVLFLAMSHKQVSVVEKTYGPAFHVTFKPGFQRHFTMNTNTCQPEIDRGV